MIQLIIEQTYLRLQDHKSNKIYIAILEKVGNEYSVKFGYCAFGRIPVVSYKQKQGSTKMSEESAQKIYTLLIKSKIRKGYQDLSPMTYIDDLREESIDIDMSALTSIIGDKIGPPIKRPKRKPKQGLTDKDQSFITSLLQAAEVDMV